MNRSVEPRNSESTVGLRCRLSPVMVAVAVVTTLVAGRDQTTSPASTPTSEWSTELASVDRALATEQIGHAIRSWELARAAASASRQWQGLLAVGDAYLRIGDAVELRRAFVGTARATYLEALERARDAAAVDGVSGVAAVLAALADCPPAERTTQVSMTRGDAI